jgi:hypothetical protein
MPLWFLAILIVFVVVSAIGIRWTIRRAIVDRLPIAEGETVLLAEEDLKVFHKIREHSGGQSLTYKSRAVLTDRRMLIATGGPEGKHKYVIKMILDYTTAGPLMATVGYGAYYRKFHLENGYPTYYISPRDVSLAEADGKPALRIDVPFPEHGSVYVQPVVTIHTSQASRYLEALNQRKGEHR